MKELNEVLKINISKPEFFCELFEDNRSVIAVEESKKYTPRTKHIALKYHQFCRYIQDKTIRIRAIDTKEQIGDIFTNPLDFPVFSYFEE